MKDRVQLLNPKTNRWIKIDTKRGVILSHKKSPNQYENIKIGQKRGGKMKFTKEEISLCKQIVERHEKPIGHGDWFIDMKIGSKPFLTLSREVPIDNLIPLWTISDCQSWLEEKGFNHIFRFMRFKLGDWSFTAEDRKYKKVRGEGKTRLEACLRAVLAVLEEEK